jgi:murein DD-endopeptidase MepM/ murein hydrolase activator NlpD
VEHFMTETPRPFPTWLRLFAALCAFAALVVTGPIAAADPPTQDEVDAAASRWDALKSDLAEKDAELRTIEARLGDAAFEVDRNEGLVEQVLAELASTRARIRENEARYERLRGRLNDRSAEAFMDGPASSLGFVLDATSMIDLSDRLEFVDAVASADATLAQDVASLGYELSLDEDHLNELKAKHLAALDQAQATEDAIQADLARAQELRTQIATQTANALTTFKQLDHEREEYLKELAAAPPIPPPTGGGKVPDSYAGLLEVCPVGQPRAFGDGFGAPRYVGGYHPHAGVDIVAPEGTPVYATFAGTAVNATNSLGGTAVQVHGKYGYTYNAHLSSIAKLGPVSTGDVIGYVSSTGLAGGTTPHDHFEFHPNVIPAGWPASYYGYTVIGTAINPYPLLVDACF